MPFKFFHVRCVDPVAAADELNQFLATHRILAVEKRFVECGENSYWSICVDYPATKQTQDTGSPTSQTKKNRVDYREVLTPDQFGQFVRLRELRSQIAQEEALPVYTVFTNEQLAAMVTESAVTLSDLAKITGVGKGRVDKYGERFLQELSQANEAVQ
jgi:superfamily II DNA helicase RecQ